MRSIRRYSNRKLYDTTERHYVTLLEVAATVRKGESVEVIEKDTGKNITAQTLVQAIFEEEKASPYVDIETLASIIRTKPAA